MDNSKLKEQVDTIRQAFGYINTFKGKTFVIKIEGNLLVENKHLQTLMNDIVVLHQMGIRIVLIPGAKSIIDDVLDKFNIETLSVGGIRISTQESIQFIKMAAFDAANRLMTLLAENRTSAIIGNWVKARGMGIIDGIDYQHTGKVDNIDTNKLEMTLDAGIVPIFPNIGWNTNGKPYNISSNELALSISRKLKASKLFFLTAKGQLLEKDFDIPQGVEISQDGTISQLTLNEAREFLELNPPNGMNESLELISMGYDACSDGVKRVHILDGKIEGILLKEIFSNRGLGTMIYSNQHENIRKMEHKDISTALSIMNDLIKKGVLVKRDFNQIEEKINDYMVYEVDGMIHGCGALHFYDEGLSAEIAAIAVDHSYENMGTGRKIVAYLIEKAQRKGAEKLFLLTTQTTDWFEALGFIKGSVEDLPEEKKEIYDHKRNSTVLILEFPKEEEDLEEEME